MVINKITHCRFCSTHLCIYKVHTIRDHSKMKRSLTQTLKLLATSISLFVSPLVVLTAYVASFQKEMEKFVEENDLKALFPYFVIIHKPFAGKRRTLTHHHHTQSNSHWGPCYSLFILVADIIWLI